MYYAPHILQKRVKPDLPEDEFGRLIPPNNIKTFVVGEQLIFLDNHLYVDKTPDGDVYWVNVCKCRCDHNRDAEIKKADGSIVKPDYHIVCEGKRPNIQVGDYVRCLESDGSVRGEGYVINAPTLNYLPYAEVYC